MVIFAITLFCLIISFLVSSKKMKYAAIFQAALSIIVFIIVFSFFPNSPLENSARKFLGEFAYNNLKNVIFNTNKINFCIFDIIIYAIFMLTILSILNIIEFVISNFKFQIQFKELLKAEESLNFESQFKFANSKIYLLFCRLLS